jgi:hypothetical protein
MKNDDAEIAALWWRHVYTCFIIFRQKTPTTRNEKGTAQ